jgi:hypothetical protein
MKPTNYVEIASPDLIPQASSKSGVTFFTLVDHYHRSAALSELEERSWTVIHADDSAIIARPTTPEDDERRIVKAVLEAAPMVDPEDAQAIAEYLLNEGLALTFAAE